MQGPSTVLQGLLLVRGPAALYQPSKWDLGEAPPSVLLAGRRVVGLPSADEARALEALGATVLDAKGLICCPGLVDLHEHLAGGGGEAGPASRTPEARLSEILSAGITTVVGLLGTDSVSRSQEALVAKCRGLEDDGITALHWCGSYRLPPATVTGSVQGDLCTVSGCVGVGEVGVSDARGSQPEPHELAALAAEARVGGLLGGASGLVQVHVGPGPGMLEPLRRALAVSDVPIEQLLPTHVDRSRGLVEDGAAWLQQGGRVDLTCGEQGGLCEEALKGYAAAGLPLERCTVSTDAYGSLPEFDAGGRLVGYGVARPGAMLRFVRRMVVEGWPLERALPLVTTNPAAALQLRGKGSLAPGRDADLLLLREGSLELEYVVAGGEVVKGPGWVRGSFFEEGPGIVPRQLALGGGAQRTGLK